MTRASIVSPWEIDDGTNTPALVVLLRAGGYTWNALQDVTHQAGNGIPPNPNLATFEVSGLSDAALDAVTADNRFFVNWEEPE